ncbi:MAG: hypothetical protein HZC29_02450 [Thaumarchaeota archaeon]|nr:hypothetical protein [Nitrososphaerota archaeon]
MASTVKIGEIRRQTYRAKSGKKLSAYDNFSNRTEVVLKSWNSQKDPPKVYVGGRRVHHGTVGLGLTVAGGLSLVASILSKDKKTKSVTGTLSQALLGIGIPLMKDDIHDMPEWFNFERQKCFSNNPVAKVSMLSYSEYA